MSEIEETLPQNENPEMTNMQSAPTPSSEPAPKNRQRKPAPAWIHWAVEGFLFAAIVVLFCLHFCPQNGNGKDADGKANTASVKKAVEMKPGNGSVVYVNLDEVEKSTLWKEKMDQLAADSAAFSQSYQSKITQWNNKYSKWQQEYAQYSQRLQSGLPSDEATETRLVNTEQQLQTEYQNMEKDLNQKLADFAQKQEDIFQELLSNMRASASKVNHEGTDAPNASFVITYSENAPSILLVDPTRDITTAVIEEMTKNSQK